MLALFNNRLKVRLILAVFAAFHIQIEHYQIQNLSLQFVQVIDSGADELAVFRGREAFFGPNFGRDPAQTDENALPVGRMKVDLCVIKEAGQVNKYDDAASRRQPRRLTNPTHVHADNFF